MLVVEAPGNHNLELASRNLEGVKLVAPAALQPYDLLRHDRAACFRRMRRCIWAGRSATQSGRSGRRDGSEGRWRTAAAAPAKAAANGESAEGARQAQRSCKGRARRRSRAKPKPAAKPKKPKAKE